jgi:hypothetical protein
MSLKQETLLNRLKPVSMSSGLLNLLKRINFVDETGFNHTNRKREEAELGRAVSEGRNSRGVYFLCAAISPIRGMVSSS